MTKKNYLLIEMALEKIYSLVSNKKTLSESIDMASKEYHLSEEEKDEINKVLDKASKSDYEDDFDVVDDIIQKPDYVIYFDSEEDLSNSIGRLMYNKVPWTEQISDKRYGIKFGNQEDLDKAIKVLKNYEFISDNDISVASIVFDDIEDFKTVMEFITKNQMHYDVNNKDVTMSAVQSIPTEFDAIIPIKKELDYDNSFNRSILIKKIWK